MNYEEVVKLLDANARNKGIQYGLGRIKEALAELDNPEAKINNIIHIAGTNGKGSTTWYVTSALKEAGYKVATYTSPHIESYTERIQINNTPIPEATFAEYFEKVSQLKNAAQLTEYEKLTIMAFLYFKEEQPDFCVLETGLGGQLDATNVVAPIITAIAKIALDHQDYLGDTLDEVTLQKAGIIKHRTPVIVIRQAIPILHIIRKTAQNLEAPLVVADKLHTIPKEAMLQGEYQKENRALAQKILMHLPITYSKKQSVLEQGLNKAQVWARYAKYQSKSQTIIIDAAHNVDGLNALLDAVAKDYPKETFSFLIGLNKHKDYKGMAQLISKKYNQIYYCQFDKDIAVSAEELKPILDKERIHILSTEDLETLPKDPHLIICGSFYLLGHIKKTIDQDTTLQLQHSVKELAR